MGELVQHDYEQRAANTNHERLSDICRDSDWKTFSSHLDNDSGSSAAN